MSHSADNTEAPHLIEIKSRASWVSSLVYGPPAMSWLEADGNNPTVVAFEALFSDEINRSLANYWRDCLRSTGDIPVKSANFMRGLADIARDIIIYEGFPESGKILYRYIGTTLLQSMDEDLTGHYQHEFVGVDPKSQWKADRLTYEEGRPRFIDYRLAQTHRDYLRSRTVAWPLRDEQDDTIRFAIESFFTTPIGD